MTTDDRAPGRYRKIQVRTWSDEKFRALSPIPPCGAGLWFFLLTGPHTGPIPGLFRAGRASMSEELGWETEAFDEAFREVSAQGMAKADFKARLVWLPKAIDNNRPESPNVIRGWGSEFDLLPECDLKDEALATLRAYVSSMGEGFVKAFDETFAKAIRKASEKVLRKGIANQEQEQDKEQEQKQDKTIVERRAATPDHDPVPEIFAYWQKTMAHPGAKLDKKRIGKIRAGLDLGYTPRQLCEAIKGCSRSPHHMGQNDRNTKYNTIDLIFRSADYIDKFIELANQNVVGTETLEQRNARIIAEFVASGVPEDQGVIDVQAQEIPDKDD
jgi:hypothetical protein